MVLLNFSAVVAPLHSASVTTAARTQTYILAYLPEAVQREEGRVAAPSKNSGSPVPPMKFMIKHNLPLVRGGSMWQYGYKSNR